MSPLNRQTRSQMSDCRFGRIIRRLWLWDIDDSSRHATDKDHASWGLPLHQVLRNRDRKQVCPIHVHAPEFPHTFDRIVDCLEVFGEAGGCDEIVDFAVLLDNLGDGCFDRFLGGDVGVVCCDFGDSVVLSVSKS